MIKLWRTHSSGVSRTSFFLTGSKRYSFPSLSLILNVYSGRFSFLIYLRIFSYFSKVKKLKGIPRKKREKEAE